MSVIGFGVVLVVIWVLLWGSVTVANVLGGILVAAALLWVIGDATPGRGGGRIHRPNVRLAPATSFVAQVLVQVVRANWVLTREVATRGSNINTGVVDVPLPVCSDGLLTLITNVMALTPGTMPVSVTEGETPVLSVHVLHLDSVDDVQHKVQQLAELAVRAFGSAEAVAGLPGLRTGTGSGELND